jgi:diguanylate cyclase (GGDEF)-like protein
VITRRSTTEAGASGGSAPSLPESDVDAALAAAGRIRTAVDDTELEIDGHPVRVTISVGVATTEGAADLALLLRRADRALYEAKQAGRNTTRALSA